MLLFPNDVSFFLSKPQYGDPSLFVNVKVQLMCDGILLL